MHRDILDTLFRTQHTKQQQLEDEEQQQQQDPTAAAIAAVAAMRVTPASLFAGVYGSNLLLNGSFLERLNSHKGGGRRLVWVSENAAAAATAAAATYKSSVCWTVCGS